MPTRDGRRRDNLAGAGGESDSPARFSRDASGRIRGADQAAERNELSHVARHRELTRHDRSGLSPRVGRSRSQRRPRADRDPARRADRADGDHAVRDARVRGGRGGAADDGAGPGWLRSSTGRMSSSPREAACGRDRRRLGCVERRPARFRVGTLTENGSSRDDEPRHLAVNRCLRRHARPHRRADTETYKIPIADGAIRAADLKKIKTDDPEDTGLVSYDPAFLNTASCRSAITFIDGDKGILRYRGYPDRAARREGDVPRGGVAAAQRRAADAARVRRVRARHHVPHVRAREHQDVPPGLPLRRASDVDAAAARSRRCRRSIRKRKNIFDPEQRQHLDRPPARQDCRRSRRSRTGT